MPHSKTACPQVVITTPPAKPAPPPPDFYSLLNKSVKRDAHRVILAVLQRPNFAHAAIGLCNTAKAFPGTPADRARFLSTVGWHFADQADFPVLADQKGLPESFSIILPLLDRRAAKESPDVKAFFTLADAIVAIEAGRREARQKELEEARRRAQDKDVVMLASKLDLISRRLDTLTLTLVPPQTEPKGKPRAKKIKVLPTLTSLKLGSDAVLALLGQVDTALEALPSAAVNDDAARADLQKQREAVEIAAQQQLHALDISFQTFKFISERLSRLDTALGPSDVDQAGSLLNALNVSFSSSNDDSDIEFQDPPQDESEISVELPAAAAVYWVKLCTKAAHYFPVVSYPSVVKPNYLSRASTRAVL
ncbi:hypothetical protein C0992_008633 [Termitomyces sp. T32_za158]|nr:hypothetical protein C0992_008633 [Termitomyces sp. T32_za158]